MTSARSTADAPRGRGHAVARGPVQGQLSSPRLRVVVCGSFRRDVEHLHKRFEELQELFEIVSPLSLDFVDPTAAFVRLAHEVSESDDAIEQRHIDALISADFVWLHAPCGHLGVSAAIELGHARSFGIPIFADQLPAELAFRPWVHLVARPSEIKLKQSQQSPGEGLRGLQSYYERAARRRGWAGESAQDTLLLMTEEMGELARAVRKSAGLARDGDWEGQDVAEELADMQLYLVHLANALGIELAAAVTAKESVNAERAAGRSAVA